MNAIAEETKPGIYIPSLDEIKDRLAYIQKVYGVGFCKAVQIWIWPEKGHYAIIEQVRTFALINGAKWHSFGSEQKEIIEEFLDADIPRYLISELLLRLITTFSKMERLDNGFDEWLVGAVKKLVRKYAAYDKDFARVAINSIIPNLFCLMELRAELMLEYFGKDAAAQEWQCMAMTVLGASDFQYSLNKYGHGDRCAYVRNRLDYAYGWFLKARNLLQELESTNEAKRECAFIQVLLNQIKETDLKITTEWNKLHPGVFSPKKWPE